MASERLTAPLVISAGAILPPVCAAVVALRFYTRKTQTATLGADDWLTIPALVWHRAATGKKDARADRTRFPDLVDWNVCFGTSRYVQSMPTSICVRSDQSRAGVALHSVGYPTPKPASPYDELHFASYQQQTTRKV